MFFNKTIKPKIVIIRSTPVNPDPRVERIVFALKDVLDISVLGFNKDFNFPVFEQKNGYLIHRINSPKILTKTLIKRKNFINKALIIFYLNLKEFFWLIKNDFDVLHACDFDTYIPALIIAKIKRKKIIYDIFDFYADMILPPPNFVKKIIRIIDMFLMRYADFVIIADENRREQIKSKRLKNVSIIYNSPPDLLDKFKKKIITPKKKAITLSYIGLLDNRQRNLNMIIELIKDNDSFRFIIAGFGVDCEDIVKKIRGLQNIKYLGGLSYKKALEEEYKSDIILAIYDPKIPNNVYASPNKLFEAMMLGKPVLMNQEIKCSEIVKKYNCGLLFEYNNPQSFKSALDKFLKQPELMQTMGKNGRLAYEKDFNFKNTKNSLKTIYNKIIYEITT